MQNPGHHYVEKGGYLSRGNGSLLFIAARTAFQKAGLSQVRPLIGGLKAWQELGLATSEVSLPIEG